jgi:hypothetical protein
MGNRLRACANFEQARRLFPMLAAVLASKISIRKSYGSEEESVLGLPMRGESCMNSA